MKSHFFILLLAVIAAVSGSPTGDTPEGDPIELPPDFERIEGESIGVGDDEEEEEEDDEEDRYYDLPPGVPGNLTEEEDRIIGGSFAPKGFYPFMAVVSIATRARGPFYVTCGGALVSNRWVVTAAQCIFPRAVEVAVRVGALHRASDADRGQFIACSKFIHHQRFIPNLSGGSAYDIAMLKIGSAVRFNLMVRPIRLENPFRNPPIGEVLIMAGWGETSSAPGARPSTYLKAGQAVAKDCTTRPRNAPSYSSIVCVQNTQQRPGRLCSGDAGSPLAYYNTRYRSWVTTGVGFWHNGNRCSQPQIFTSIGYFRRWIDQIMRTQ